MADIKETVHIAFGFDENYAMPCGVSMLSICKNTPDPVCFHALIAKDVTEESKRQIEEIVSSYGKEIRWYVVDPSQLKDLSEFQYFSKSVYNRLLIPDLLPAEVEKVLYLDSDIIALQSLTPLWKTELSDDEPAAMGIDNGGSNVIFLNRIDIPLSRPYFNNGVILMNLSCWRKEGISRKCLKSIAESNYVFPDQDAINVVIGERVKMLHPQFNLMVDFLTKDESEWLVEKGKYFQMIHEAKEDTVILHYIGSLKPWHQGCPEADHWLKYKALSPWKDNALERLKYKGWYKIETTIQSKTDILDFQDSVEPYFTVIQWLSSHHHRIYVLVRKTLWTIVRHIQKQTEGKS